MSFNQDELVPPEWMDKKFFEKVLCKAENVTEVNISDLSINPATKVGDHFASIMFRVSVSYSTNTKKNETISLIVKTKPFVDGIKKTMLGESKIFPIEMRMYDEIIPEMHRLLRTIGDETVFSARMLYSAKEPTDVLVFDDLTKLDYTLPTQTICFEGAKLIFSKLGKWHACSMVMHENHFDFSDFDVNLFNGSIGGDDIIKFIESNLTILLNLLPKWEMEKYQPNLDSFIKNLQKRGEETFAPSIGQNAWNVLNHGDLHSKNMMMKMNEDKIEDILFVDFQIANYASPALDINYATFTAIDEDSRERKLEIIEIYYTELMLTLRKLGYKGRTPSMLDLQLDIMKKGFVKVYTGLTFLPFMYIDFSKISIDDLMDPSSEHARQLREAMFSFPTSMELIKKYFMECVREGHL